jgi:hypothetical protein
VKRGLTFFVSQFQIQISMGMCHFCDRPAGAVLDGIPQSAFQSCVLEVDVYSWRFQQDPQHIGSTGLQCSHNWGFPAEKNIDVGVTSQHSLCQRPIVGFGCQMQQIAVLMFDIKLEEGALQSIV